MLSSSDDKSQWMREASLSTVPCLRWQQLQGASLCPAVTGALRQPIYGPQGPAAPCSVWWSRCGPSPLGVTAVREACGRNTRLVRVSCVCWGDREGQPLGKVGFAQSWAGAAPAHTGELQKAELGPWLVWSWGVCKVRSWDTSSLLVADEFG